MQNATAMLYCPNYSCQTPNPETHKFCQKCRTPLPRHYLWAVGEGVAGYGIGDLLANRYLCKSLRIFLDTKPGLVCSPPTEIPPAFGRYLRLSPYRLHVPQIYELLQRDSATVHSPVLLLDEAAVYAPPSTAEIQILPGLVEVWHTASGLRQLNWLWQIAQLWQPLKSEQSASSLLVPELLRVEGSVVRLLELYGDGVDQQAPTLAQLGQQWSTWVASAQPTIAAYLEQLCQQLIQADIHSAEQLVAVLDQGLTSLGQRQTRKIQIATSSDRGPTRQRNEDACFPPSGTVRTQTISTNQTAADPALVIVCDGIGGHQGGDIASNLAIATVQQQLQPLHPEQLEAAALSAALENAVWAANDQISQRNDAEQRLDRQRMGTTIVMALVRAHEIYTTHVGDSRAYWITRWSCRQVTLDDDIASREVRLGYSTYREALQQPSAGSLVQALGMAASDLLYPTVQRFILDEDCIFLLCSDGLSDNDRIEEIWDTDILPLLDGKLDVAAISERLVAIANTRNGHDNVTIGLLYCQVAEQQNPTPLTAPTTTQVTAKTVTLEQNQNTVVPTKTAPATMLPPGSSASSTLKTQILQPPRPKPNLLPLLLGIFLLLGLGALLIYFLLPALNQQEVGLNPQVVPESSDPPSGASSDQATLQPRAFVQVDRSNTEENGAIAPLVLLPTPPSTSPTPSTPSTASPAPTPSTPTSPNNNTAGNPVGKQIPPNSILQVLQVLERPGSSAPDRWVQVRVCSVPSSADRPSSSSPSPASSSPPGETPSNTTTSGEAATESDSSARAESSRLELIRPGNKGWVRETAISLAVVPNANLTFVQQGACAEPSTAPSTPASTPPTRSPVTPPAP